VLTRLTLRAQPLRLLILGLLLFPLSACQDPPQAPLAAAVNPLPAPKAMPKESPLELVWPQSGAYTGAYIDFGEAEDTVTLEAIEGFAAKVNKHQAVIASSSFWGEQSFPTKNMQLIHRYGAIPLLFWSPWDRPYQQSLPPDRFSLNAILEGKWDDYIDRWADEAKSFGQPLLVAWGLEMNGTWFPWSGWFYGGGKQITGSNPPRFKGPELYKRAYHYVIDRVRARGVSNISWGFHINHYTSPHQDWNMPANYYPGDDYVDWIGASVYGMQFAWQGWGQFQDNFDESYQQLCDLHPDKPVVVAEWGVGEFPKKGNKAEWLTRAFSDFKQRYPRVRVAVYWNERWQNADESYSNLRLNSSPEALQAYRQGIADSYWLDRPQYRPRSE
jgi:hypothetical protein